MPLTPWVMGIKSMYNHTQHEVKCISFSEKIPLKKKSKMKRPYSPKTWFLKITENKIRLWREKAFPDNLALDGNQLGSHVRYPLLFNSCHRISSREQQPFVLSLLAYSSSLGRLTRLPAQGLNRLHQALARVAFCPEVLPGDPLRDCLMFLVEFNAFLLLV